MGSVTWPNARAYRRLHTAFQLEVLLLRSSNTYILRASSLRLSSERRIGDWEAPVWGRAFFRHRSSSALRPLFDYPGWR